MVKRLVREPFCLPHERIARLTPYQVKYHYFCPDPSADKPGAPQALPFMG